MRAVLTNSYKLAGVQSYISIPIFSKSATVVLGPTGIWPSGVLVAEIMKHQQLRALYLPPSIIEQWVAEPPAMDQAKNLDFIIFGGGPLSPAVGDRLNKATKICQTYGSLETAGVQLLVPRPGEWSYLEFNPYEEIDMQDFGDGSYELVLHQRPDLAWRRALSHNLPNVTTWRTGDLFVRHPSVPQLWRFSSRVDDLIVFGSGHKLKPIPMELIIQGSHLVAGALVVGHGRPQPALIVEPSAAAREMNHEQILRSVWPVVKKSNEIAPSYAQIILSKVIIGSLDKPFLRAPKGTIIRKLTADRYSSEIEDIYALQPLKAAMNGAGPSLPVTYDIIQRCVRRELEHFKSSAQRENIEDSDNFFQLGLDSLKMAELAHKLRSTLSEELNTEATAISLRLTYKFPTALSLSEAIFKLISTPGSLDERPFRDTNGMQESVFRFTQDLPGPVATKTQVRDENGINVVIFGARGSLGPNIIRSFLHDGRVSKIYCLSRAQTGLEELRAIFLERNFGSSFDDSRLEFYPITLAQERLGIPPAQWDKLKESVHLVIHNSWKVDFSLPLEHYKGFLQSVRCLVDFCADSSIRPRLLFCSSISSVQDWANVYPGSKVPDAPPSSEIGSYDVCSPLGYGQSKHVAERILAKASEECGVPVTILRIGQVAGPTPGSGGMWSSTEWIPSLVRISKSLNMVPVDLPQIDWIPADAVSAIIREVSLFAFDGTSEPGAYREILEAVNIVNPHMSPPTLLSDVLQERVGNDLRTTTLRDWVSALGKIECSTSSMGQTVDGNEASLIIKMLPWFQHLSDTVSENRVIQPEFETENGIRMSPTLASLAPISSDLMRFWFSQWEI